MGVGRLVWRGPMIILKLLFLKKLGGSIWTPGPNGGPGPPLPPRRNATVHRDEYFFNFFSLGGSPSLWTPSLALWWLGRVWWFYIRRTAQLWRWSQVGYHGFESRPLPICLYGSYGPDDPYLILTVRIIWILTVCRSVNPNDPYRDKNRQCVAVVFLLACRPFMSLHTACRSTMSLNVACRPIMSLNTAGRHTMSLNTAYRPTMSLNTACGSSMWLNTT